MHSKVGGTSGSFWPFSLRLARHNLEKLHLSLSRAKCCEAPGGLSKESLKIYDNIANIQALVTQISRLQRRTGIEVLLTISSDCLQIAPGALS